MAALRMFRNLSSFCQLIFFATTACIFLHASHTSVVSAIEYCLTESFIAQCPDNEMILIERAVFGRMELGRCVTRNYGHLGCSVDVVAYVDAVCSGLRHCELSVSDPALVRTKPCPPDFSSYLDATYRCVPVLTPTSNNCGPQGIRTVQLSDGYIVPSPLPDTTASDSSPFLHGQHGTATASNGQHGSSTGSTSDDASDNPWPCLLVFRLAVGQQLNVTLLDFTANVRASAAAAAAAAVDAALLQNDLDRPEISGDSGGSSLYLQSHQHQLQLQKAEPEKQQPCGEYAVITEPTNGLRTVVCGFVSTAAGLGSHEALSSTHGFFGAFPPTRERHVYTSQSNLVHIKMAAWPQDATPVVTNSGWIDDVIGTGSSMASMLSARYVIRFEVLGCGEFLGKAPEGGRIKVETGRRVTVYCTAEGESGDNFELVCDGRHWRGDRRNCSALMQPSTTTPAAVAKIHSSEKIRTAASRDVISLPPLGISLVIIFGVAFVVVLYISITIVFALFIRRRRCRRKRRELNVVSRLSESPFPASRSPVASSATAQLSGHASNEMTSVYHQSTLYRSGIECLDDNTAGGLDHQQRRLGHHHHLHHDDESLPMLDLGCGRQLFQPQPEIVTTSSAGKLLPFPLSSPAHFGNKVINGSVTSTLPCECRCGDGNEPPRRGQQQRLDCSWCSPVIVGNGECFDSVREQRPKSAVTTDELTGCLVVTSSSSCANESNPRPLNLTHVTYNRSADIVSSVTDSKGH